MDNNALLKLMHNLLSSANSCCEELLSSQGDLQGVSKYEYENMLHEFTNRVHGAVLTFIKKNYYQVHEDVQQTIVHQLYKLIDETLKET